jgi:sec-independent protein translocase protein TatC
MGMQDKTEMSFLEHLEELRWHLVRSILAVLIVATVCFIFKDIVFDKIIFAPTHPDFFTNRMLRLAGGLLGIDVNLNPGTVHFISRKMSGQFMAHIMVSVISGIVVAFPYILYEMWGFIAPALYATEKKYTRKIFFYSSFLFFAGVFFGYYVIAPLSVDFLMYYSTSARVETEPDIMSYITTVSSAVLASGIMFELPMLIYFLSKMGILTPEFLKKYRKHAFVVILIISAIITPPDVFSQLLVCIPIFVLYELSIKISSRINKKQQETT